ncbi:hypothetical protein DFJ73DRAFT_964151 [Zopfochytrium polystomum]|nr:hypothetical protein DFJ73DRAFT_964151 [Zopfochytrium polystomum]
MALSRMPSESNVLFRSPLVEPYIISASNYGLRCTSAVASSADPPPATSSTSVAIAEGTLLLRERPVLGWPRGSYSTDLLVPRLLVKHREALRRSQEDPPTSSLTTLFPRNVAAEVPAGRAAQITDTYVAGVIARVLELESANDPEPAIDRLAAALSLSDPSPVAAGRAPPSLPPPTRDDVLWATFVLDFNSFPSGLNLFLSLVNHSCDPNCKVVEDDPSPSPPASTTSNRDPETARAPTYTLFALRPIAPGAPLSISYLDLDRDVSLAADRRRYLEEHYLFFCTCTACGTRSDADPTSGEPPRGEDYLCGGCGSGRVDAVAGGPCDTCGATMSAREMEKREDRVFAIVRRTRVLVERVVAAVGRLEDERGKEEGKAEEEEEDAGQGGGRVRFAARAETAVEELARLVPELEALGVAAEAVVYSKAPHRHVLFRPIDFCVAEGREALAKHGRGEVRAVGAARRSKKANKPIKAKREG